MERQFNIAALLVAVAFPLRKRMLQETLTQQIAIIGGLMLIPNCAMAQNDIHWTESGVYGGEIPFNAVVGGYEGGLPLYVCRAYYLPGYGTQPGKFRQGLPGCSFGFGGQEIYDFAPSFQFLIIPWKLASSGEVPANAVVGGYEAPAPGQLAGPALYYCRAFLGTTSTSYWQLGKIRPEFGACLIPYGGKEVPATDYNVLVQGIPYASVTASNGVVPPDAIRGGRDDDGTDLYICNAFFMGGQHPGKLRSDFGGCDVSWGGTEHVVTTYQVLVPAWSIYPPAPGTVDAFNFPAGTDIDGTLLQVCRAPYLGGVELGKTRWDWTTCNFGYGGKEILVSDYDILSSSYLIIK
jgi:hypothetical protein